MSLRIQKSAFDSSLVVLGELSLMIQRPKVEDSRRPLEYCQLRSLLMRGRCRQVGCLGWISDA